MVSVFSSFGGKLLGLLLLLACAVQLLKIVQLKAVLLAFQISSIYGWIRFFIAISNIYNTCLFDGKSSAGGHRQVYHYLG